MLRSCLLVFALLVGPVSAVPAAAAQFKVMIVTWRGCEEACRGVQDYLQQRGVDTAFLLRDAAGQVEALPKFVAEARSARVDLIVTYGTSVTRGMAGTLANAGNPAFAPEIPKVFMVVADPVGVGIVRSLESSGRTDVTGTYNRVPERVNIETIRAYRPGFRKLGLLYNAYEKNSVVKRDEVEALSRSMKFDLVTREIALGTDGRPRADDIAPKLAELKDAGVDFVYVGSSSFLRENAAAFAAQALQLGLPVLTPYEADVRDARALISVAARYTEVGRLAGAQAEKILVQRVPAGSLPVARLTRFAVVINMQVAKKLKLVPPLELLQVAETVN